MFLKKGKVDDEASKTGALANGVPGALAAYDLALKKHGKLKLADLLLPAAEIAEKGFAIDEVYARKLVGVGGSSISSMPRRIPSSSRTGRCCKRAMC